MGFEQRFAGSSVSHFAPMLESAYFWSPTLMLYRA